MQPLISVIMPCYNCGKYIKEAINSVLNQSYNNFEILVVDDLSTDNSIEIIKKLQKKDKRIRLFQLEKKGGASIARNKAIKEAKGKYIAFLDGDDRWKKDKLKKQVAFMEKNDIYFSYTDYEFIDGESKKKGIYRKCPNKISYLTNLLGNSIGCLTVMYNAEKIGLIEIPKIDKRNDYAIWCKALKKVKRGYKIDEILSEYRVVGNNSSLSSVKKTKLLKYHYQLHRNVNNFNPFISILLTISNIINFVFIKIFREKKKQV